MAAVQGPFDGGQAEGPRSVCQLIGVHAMARGPAMNAALRRRVSRRVLATALPVAAKGRASP